MREIKFRGWVKSSNKMLPVYDLGLSNVDQYTIGIADCGDLNCGLCVDYYEKHEVEVMQYTGLKDKNGKEIFEGDIVKCFKSHNSLVRFAMYSFGLKTKVRGFEPFYDIYGQCEVIGNIYENPELLEEPK